MANLFGKEDDGAIAGYARVAPERGVDLGASGLTYAVPASLDDLQIGERVTVPLGRSSKPVYGYVVERMQECDLDPKRVKAIAERDPFGLKLPADLIELAQWISSYYCCPLGMTIATMLPAAVKKGTGRVQRQMVSLAAESPADVKLSKLQQSILDAARQSAADGEHRLELRHLADLAGAKTTSPVKQLIEKGLLTASYSSEVHADWGDLSQEVKLESSRIKLNKSQEAALQHLADRVHKGFGTYLLHGVTGSGKTEVYLRMIEHVIGLQHEEKRDESGALHGAIVLVPEIALTPQTVSRFTARFDRVAVLHSALTAAQRHDQWRRIEAGEARIVVGARSAIFAPLPRVDIIIVDEEHDTSYKQDQLPRYHARDVAVRRGHLLGVPVVLGSATPSLESYNNATELQPDSKGKPAARPRYDLLELPERVGNFKLPHVQLVDMIEQRRQRRGVHLISQRLEDLIKYTKRQGGQSILLLNRRGYANYIACPDHHCGWIMGCNHCDVTVVYHRDQKLPTGGYVRCHHCDAEQMLPNLCPDCGKKVTLFGLGTQRVEEELDRKFPDLTTMRMDSDAMRSRQDYQRTLDQFRRGEVDVLLGTQMIAKGLDFPNVLLVGVISGDTSLNMPDFRATERTFQLIAQVAGRAGRGEKPGTVVVQTFSPNDPTIQLAAKHDYNAFAAAELKIRKDVGLPPFSRMARIVVRNRDHAKGYEQARELANHLQDANTSLGGGVRLRGPMPCPIARVADYHRQQIELIAPPPTAAVRLQKLLTTLRGARLLTSDAQTAVDVDPVSLL